MSEEAVQVVKRGPGRPRKVLAAKPAAEPKQPEAPKYKMKAKPNWEEIDPNQEDTPDKFRIPRDMWPEGFALQWVRESVYGQPDPQNVGQFARGGWTPVHQEDFDGRFDGMFMPRGVDSYIGLGGLILVARPMELQEKARKIEKRNAREAIEIKERALRGGNLPNVALDTQHESALRTNRIGKSYERIVVPSDK